MVLKLSIIIPCYNIREYIEECLGALKRAVLNRDDVEIVVVDDGSTDSTSLEVNRWKDRFANFSLIQTENRGVSHARNLGVKNAIGEYVLFVDGDDKVDYKSFRVMLDELYVNDADVLCTKFHWWEGDHSWETGDLSLPKKKVLMDSEVAIKSLFKDQQFYLWTRFFKKTLFNGIEFPEGKVFEDVALIPEIYGKAESFYYIPVPMIYYRQRGGSIVNSKSWSNIIDFMNCFEGSAFTSVTGSLAYERDLFLSQVYIWCINDSWDSALIKRRQRKDISKKLKSMYYSFLKNPLKAIIMYEWSQGNYKFVAKLLLAISSPPVYQNIRRFSMFFKK